MTGAKVDSKGDLQKKFMPVFQVGLLKGLAFIVMQTVGAVAGAGILCAVVPEGVGWHNDSNAADDHDTRGTDYYVLSPNDPKPSRKWPHPFISVFPKINPILVNAE